MSKKKRIQKTYSPEFRDRAIRMVLEQQSKYRYQWAAIKSIAEKVGCGPPTLHGWIKKREATTTEPSALSSAERDRLKELEREVKELKTANEILRKASAFFAEATFRQSEHDGQAFLRRPK